MYIYEYKDWPNFTWDLEQIADLLADVRFNQGKLLGAMETLGFDIQEEAVLKTLTADVLKSSEIEGEILNADQVRSSIARRLGMDIAGLVLSDRNVEGIVEMMLDATQNFAKNLSEERLFGWHANLFPTGRSGLYKIIAGNWRENSKDDPMQVVSGAMGHERIHYQAPDSEDLPNETKKFFDWFNADLIYDPILKAGIAHLWFVTLHPFDDGNGRISRAIADMQLSRADKSAQRFYSMSAQIRLERNKYYDILEQTQSSSLDITNWLVWFLKCLNRALFVTDNTLASVKKKAKFWENLNLIVLNDRQKLMINKLLDGFDGKLTSSKWAKIAKCSQDTAGRDIQNLVDKGIIIKDSAGGRSTSYSLNENY